MPEYTVITEQACVVRRSYRVVADRSEEVLERIRGTKPLGHTLLPNEAEVVTKVIDALCNPIAPITSFNPEPL